MQSWSKGREHNMESVSNFDSGMPGRIGTLAFLPRYSVVSRTVPMDEQKLLLHHSHFHVSFETILSSWSKYLNKAMFINIATRNIVLFWQVCPWPFFVLVKCLTWRSFWSQPFSNWNYSARSFSIPYPFILKKTSFLSLFL